MKTRLRTLSLLLVSIGFVLQPSVNASAQTTLVSPSGVQSATSSSSDVAASKGTPTALIPRVAGEGSLQPLADKGKAKPLGSGDRGVSYCPPADYLCYGYAINRMFREEYDTAKSFLENCSNTMEAWRGFDRMNEAVSNMSNDPNLYLAYREFLKSILYLNTKDPEWYCRCVASIGGTFAWNGPTRGRDGNASLAVTRYLFESGKCPQEDSEYRAIYTNGRWGQHRDWVDTAGMMEHKFQDTADFPLDTTLPSIHSLGLDILLGPNASAASSMHGDLLANVRVIDNPFRKETEVEINLPEAAYIQYDVTDVMGRIVYGEEHGHVYLSGEHRLPLALSALPLGHYYLRLSSPSGATRTLKLMKE